MKRFIKNPWLWIAVFTSAVMTIRIINDIPKPPRIGHTYKLAVWSTSEYEGVTAEVIKVTPTGVIAQLNNNSPICIEEQGWTSLQMLRNGEWYAVCALDPNVNLDIGIEETHPEQLPIEKINIENAQLRQHQYTKDNIENILNDLESFHFKRNRRFGDSVGWTLGIFWSENDSAKWMALYDNCIEYEGYIYTTEYVEEYSEYWSQLLGLFEDTSEQPYIIGTYEETSDEMTQECLEDNTWIILVEHHEMSDGTWQTDDYTYQYRLEISGGWDSAVKDVAYIYLSNIENITFEQAWKASGLSSSMSDYFDEEDAKLVAIKTIEK